MNPSIFVFIYTDNKAVENNIIKIQSFCNHQFFIISKQNIHTIFFFICAYIIIVFVLSYSVSLRLWVLCCDVRYDFRMKTIFGSSSPQVVCIGGGGEEGGSCPIYVICVCFRIVVPNTCCVVFMFCLSSSCAPNVASFSGLSIFECPFGIL